MRNDELQFSFEIAMRTRCSEATCIGYEQDLWRFFNYFNQKGKEVVDLTTQEINHFLTVQALLKDEEGNPIFSNKSINRSRAAIKGLYDHAIMLDLIHENPVSAIKSLPVDDEVVTCFSENEVVSLLAYLDGTSFVAMRDHFMVRLSLYTGLTSYEVLHVTSDQFDFEKGCLTVYDANQQPRLVPLPNVLKEEYDRYLKEREEKGWQEDYLFVTNTGNPIKAQSYSNTLNKYTKKMRLLKPISQSILRHTYAHQKIKEGVGVETLCTLLGHNNPYYTQKLYRTWFDQAKDLTQIKVRY